jgi:hypothetical protein
MRLAVLALLMMAGCGGDPLIDPVIEDLGVSDLTPIDLTPGPDLAVRAECHGVVTGCGGLVACLRGCADDACVTTCQECTSNGGLQRLGAVRECASTACSDRGDLGTAPCMRFPGHPTIFVDGAGQPAGACNACLADAEARLFGRTCARDAGTCDPMACAATVDACLEDLP